MSAFKFSLQQVLDLREQHQQQVAIKLSNAQAEAAEARDAQRVLEEIRHAGAEALQTAHGGEDSTVGQLRTLAYVIEQLNHRVIDAQERVEATTHIVDQARAELSAALQARQVLTRLRDRHFAGWRAQADGDAIREMDEVALVRHVRGELAALANTTPAGSE
jgi:flagellar export protein FliJ